MTRKTIFRLTLALLLLPNFAAYWWMLPRRMKRCRTAMQALMQIQTRRMMDSAWKELGRAFEVGGLFNSGVQIQISERNFRLPFQVQK